MNPEKDIKLYFPLASKEVIILIFWIKVAKEGVVLDKDVPISWTDEDIKSLKYNINSIIDVKLFARSVKIISLKNNW